MIATQGSGERGSAAVDFVLVAPVLLLVGLAVLQLTLALYVRTTVTSAAAEGARAAALAGANLEAGARRTRALLGQTMAGDTVRSVSAQREVRDGLLVVTVGVETNLPLVGLLGPTVMHLDGHALAER